MQEELFDIIIDKYYNKDIDVQMRVDSIRIKQEEMRIKREEKKNNLANKIKKAFIVISRKTAELCEKLLRKEQLSNEIMGTTENNKQIADAHDEVADKLMLAYKDEFNSQENE